MQPATTQKISHVIINTGRYPGVFGYRARVKHMANVLVIAKQPASGMKDPYGSMANFFRVELLKKRLEKK
jgi:hypothetical protein